VWTEGADREQLVPTARKQHRLAVCVPQQHRTVGDLRERNPCDEVRPAERRYIVHSISKL
jgi:hypothetical protein